MLTVPDLLRGAPEPGQENDPLAHLTACHRRVEQRLETLARAGAEFGGRRDEAHRAIAAALAFFAVNGARHTADEEESVFPRLIPRLSADERAIIERLEADHVEAAALHRRLEDLATQLDSGLALGEFRACVHSLTALYARHIAIEDSEVAAMIRRYLTTEDLVAIRAEMKQRRQKDAA